MGLLDFVLGKCVLSTSHKNAAKLLNICMRHEIGYTAPEFSDGMFCIKCHKLEGERIKKACSNRGIEVSERYVGGIPTLFQKYKKRVGLFAGIVIAVAIVISGMNVVWRIDISGNVEINSAEILRLLDENGFSVGSFIPAADITLTENRIMESNADIAWISINMNGTVANVEIRERKKGDIKPEKPANLVAIRDGKIERVESYNGQCTVKVGDVVRAGDILVSGIYLNENGNYRAARAEGQIYARTLREFSVEIPFENTQKAYTGLKKREIYINFFENHIKVFANTGNLPPTCDIIYKNGEMGLPSFPSIPVGVKMIEYVEYSDKNVILSESQAMEQAFAVLDEELSLLSEKIELLEKNIEFEISDSSYVLNCQLVCIEDIASVKEIE